MDDNKRSAGAVDAGVSEEEPSNNKRAKKLPAYQDEYEGHAFATADGDGDGASSSATIDRVKLSDLTPETFYRDYVARRRPVVVVGGMSTENDAEWKVSDRWTSAAYLKDKAGDVEIMVEKRNGRKNEKFGKGNEEKLTVTEFLDLIESGSDEYYLTTQDVKTDASGRPHVMSPFMQRLSDDFPLRPKLAGNLIPQNINVWMGRSGSGSGKEGGGTSSGLHHDYHDNLYVMVSGRKKFDLYCPSDAPYLYPRGKLCRIHKNGRINYAGEETNADGSEEGAERALDASIAQEEAVKELEEAEAAVEAGEEGAEERLAAAEEALDGAMEAVMDAEEEGSEDDDGGDDGGGGFGDDDDDDEGADEGLSFWEAAEKKKQELLSRGAQDGGEEEEDLDKKGKATVESSKDEAAAERAVEVNGEFTFEEEEGRLVDKTVKDPLNFSLVDITLDKDALREKFPKFAKARVATTEIVPGDVLYLPASWFHEVFSYGDGDDGKESTEEGEKTGHHMAFNYWFHPPDGSTFSEPYTSAFWKKDWKLRKLDS